MIKVAVLDDYQRVTHKFANWDKLQNKIELSFFDKYIRSEKKLIQLLKEFDVLCLMRERTKLNSEIIDKLPNLKLVITSGMWNPSVDAKKLKQENILFCGTDNRFNSTAELSWMLTMIVWRGALLEIENMKKGKWQTEIGRSLFGKTIGIFGLGRQGKQVAKFAKSFGMNVIAWSHNLTKELCKKENVIYVEEKIFFQELDILSIHTKLSERTENFVNMEKITLMKNSSIIINTSRGPIVNEKDLIYCLENKKISGAGLDVYDVEPLPSNHLLRKMSKTLNLVLTPHIGYVSEETYQKFHNGYVLAIEAFLKNKPINVLN
tara:strand:- start:814 stop:1773 length:960 start_codon:yes stop_codon:yes gene_type:complete